MHLKCSDRKAIGCTYHGEQAEADMIVLDDNINQGNPRQAS